MPAAPAAVFTPPAAPAPGAAPAVFVPAGVPTPGAPGAVFTAPGVPAPAAPPAIFPPVVDSGAFLETIFAGANNDLRFEQIGSGTLPTIEFTMDNSGSNPVVATFQNTIVVYLSQTFGSCFLTAADIKTLFETSSAARALVRVTHKAGNNGSGAICQPATTDISFGPWSLAFAV